MSRESMQEVTAVFWDIGGVILSNGWDHTSRAAASGQFSLDAAEFESRHEIPFADYEKGKITLDAYLDQAVFYRPRPFTKDEFRDFIFARSAEYPESRAILDELFASGRYLVAALNNEGRELNEYRVRKFHLTRSFSAFFTSCYLGLRKPDPAIYRLALDVTQRSPQESIFIDDRPNNIAGAQEAGMRTILFESPPQLRAALLENSVAAAIS